MAMLQFLVSEEQVGELAKEIYRLRREETSFVKGFTNASVSEKRKDGLRSRLDVVEKELKIVDALYGLITNQKFSEEK